MAAAKHPTIRPCICGNRSECKRLTAELHKYQSHRGYYAKLPHSSAGTDRGKRGRRITPRALQMLQVSQTDVDSYADRTGLYVSHLHFPPEATLGIDNERADFMLNRTITPKEARDWNLTVTSADKSPLESDNGNYLVLPYRSLADADQELVGLRRAATLATPAATANKRSAAPWGSMSESVLQSASPSSSSPPSMGTTSHAVPTSSFLLSSSSSSSSTYNLQVASPATASAQSYSRVMEENRGLKRQLDQANQTIAMQADMMDTRCREWNKERAELNREIGRQQRELEGLKAMHAAEDDEGNREVLQKEVDKVKMTKELLERGGLSRLNLTSDQWHGLNPGAAKLLFGFKDWHETRMYCWAFWPEMDQRPVDDTSCHITEFEKCLITKMRFRRRFEEGFLALIWGRNNRSINNYTHTWAPKWGRAGRALSVLDIDEGYLSATLPAAYSVLEVDVGALIDGKDFLTHTDRQLAALKNAMYSNKMHASAFRVIVWSTPSGLIFERTCPVLGRPSESRLVRMWRDNLGKVGECPGVVGWCLLYPNSWLMFAFPFSPSDPSWLEHPR
jgi:hypothetical protein